MVLQTSCRFRLKYRFRTLVLLAWCVSGCSTFLCSCDKAPSSTTKKVKCVTCANGGSCINDTCVCPAGYEGTNCELASIQKFVGNWVVSEKGSATLAAQYPISISRGPLATDLVIRNFNNYFTVPVTATIYHDTVYIPNQVHEGRVVFGIGYIHSGTSGQYGAIDMAYEIVDTATGAVNDFGFDTAYHGNPSVWNR